MYRFRKRITSFFLAVVMLFSVTAVVGVSQDYKVADAASDNYYSGITANGGTALLGQLHDLIVDTHKTYTSYADCRDYGHRTDPGLDGKGVLEFYTHETIMNFVGGIGDWNREHVWCQSLSGGLWGTSGGGSDLHHIRPSESGLNSIRGNNKYGKVSGGKEAWSRDTNKNNSKLGGHVGGGTFEPLDNVKGDVARIVMYVYTHYNNASNVGGTKESKMHGNLPFTNVISAGNSAAAEKLLLEWNRLDPVDDIERYRNEAVYKIQGNRNPFIDNSSYADAIWGNGDVTPPEPVTLTGLNMNASSLNLKVGQSGRLSVTPVPANASASVTWSTSNGRVATVTNGVVTAKAEGTATITATSTENSAIKATATVTVRVPDEGDDELTGTYIIAINLTNASDVNKVLYFNGSIANSYYLGTTETLESSATVEVEKSGDGYTLKTGNQYIEAVTSGEHVNATLQNSSSGVWKYSAELNTLIWNITASGKDYYLGTRTNNGKTYTTISASETSYVTGDNEDKLGVTQFIVDFIPVGAVIPPEPVTLTGLTMNASSLTLKAGQSASFTVTPTPANASASVTWTTSNAAVATVANGIVSAKAEGTAIITATSTENPAIKATATVTVKAPSSGDDELAGTYNIAIDLTNASDVNKVLYFNGAIANDYYLGTTENVSGAAQVVVEKSGDGYTLKTGNQYIEAVTSGEHVNATLQSSSSGVWKYSDELNTFLWNITASGKDYYLGTRTNESGKTYTTISASETSYITGGNADKVGVTQFIVDFIPVGTVTPPDPPTPPVEKLVLSDERVSVQVGGESYITAEGLEAADINWSSSDETVATVDASGKITGVKKGTCTLTATLKSDPSVKATAEISVFAEDDVMIYFELEGSLGLSVGESWSPRIFFVPDRTIEVEWSSNNEAVATVDGNGKITAVGVGEAIIRVTSKENPAIYNLLEVKVVDAPVIDSENVKAFKAAVEDIDIESQEGMFASLNAAIKALHKLSAAEEASVYAEVGKLEQYVTVYNAAVAIINSDMEKAESVALKSADGFAKGIAALLEALEG